MALGLAPGARAGGHSCQPGCALSGGTSPARGAPAGTQGHARARDGPWESSMRRFNFVHVFQHKPRLSVGVSGVAQTCFVPCLEEIRRSALAFPECHQAQQSCADPDCGRDITKILMDFLSP